MRCFAGFNLSESPLVFPDEVLPSALSFNCSGGSGVGSMDECRGIEVITRTRFAAR